MATKPRVICFVDPAQDVPPCETLSELPREAWIAVSGPQEALRHISEGGVRGVWVDAAAVDDFERILQKERVLDEMPQGVALLDTHNRILWANEQLRRWAHQQVPGGQLTGTGFYQALDDPTILGPDYCPFATALATEQPANSLIKTGDNRYYSIHAVPVIEHRELPESLLVTLVDVTQEKLQQERLEAIHQAGAQLADMKPEEIFDMSVEERVELLKDTIQQQTQDLLDFDVIEIRLLDQKTGELTPLLSVGIKPDACGRPLYAKASDNGVTGFVAATKKSYLCEDTASDPLYIEGCEGAKSSMTVPLIWHEEVIGTFNVESPEPRAFTDSDLKFLELYAREVAVALNTLELLVAQQANAAQQSVEAIHSEVALPVDAILNDAVNVMEQYIGHDSDVRRRLERILRNARDIKRVIQKVGQRMAPAEAVPAGMQLAKHPRLRDARLLVVDADENVRNDAHSLLERYDCIVETAHTGREAVLMVRNADPAYHAIISDIRLPDMNGYDLQCRLGELMDPVPLILMTGYGYDPAHTIVKARQAGLHPKAILYKPFRLDQLIGTVETILEAYSGVGSS